MIAAVSIGLVGGYYYLFWGYLPWWDESEHYNHKNKQQ